MWMSKDKSCETSRYTEKKFGLIKKKLIIFKVHLVLKTDMHDKLLIKIRLNHKSNYWQKGESSNKNVISSVYFRGVQPRRTINMSCRSKSSNRYECIFNVKNETNRRREQSKDNDNLWSSYNSLITISFASE